MAFTWLEGFKKSANAQPETDALQQRVDDLAIELSNPGTTPASTASQDSSFLQSILPQPMHSFIRDHRSVSIVFSLMAISTVLMLAWRVAGHGKDNSKKKKKKKSIFDKIESASAVSTNIDDIVKQGRSLSGHDGDEDTAAASLEEGHQYATVMQTKFVGLRNEGATCYLNSLLQTLYHIPYFRRAVFQIPTQNSRHGVVSALQGVFYNLQMAKGSSVSTRTLIQSFGWSSDESFVQHDVQELARLLLDLIDTEVRRSPVDGVIQDLFEGEMRNFIRCLHVDYESVSQDRFLDLQLDVKGCADITSSLDRYTETEVLQGENQYRAGEHGLQDARRGTIFVNFPPVLMIHLKRFEFDMVGGLSKVNQVFAFDDELDLKRFTVDLRQDNRYTLHAVLVHQGRTGNAGHYYSFINTSPDPERKTWRLFDDDHEVRRVSPSEAISSNFGGLGQRGSAYMLVYVKKSEAPELLKPVDMEKDVPTYLKDRFEQSGCSVM